MQVYTAIISKNITPYSTGDPFLSDHVKVRIPSFHGPKTSDAYNLMPSDIYTTPAIASDDELPWAIINRGFDNNTFSAESFNEDDIVSVILQNDSMNSPIIIGFASRFSYTEDPNVASNNKNFGLANIETLGGGLNGTGFTSVPGASAIVKIAKGEVGYISKQSDSKLDSKTANPSDGSTTPHTKYFKEAIGSSCGEWCMAFCWWCYNKAGWKDYFCEGHTYVSCTDVMNYYKKQGKFSTTVSNAKVGDLLFLDFGHGNHVELVVEDQFSDYIQTIGGNTYKDGQSSGATCVAKKKRSTNFVGIAHMGTPNAPSYSGLDNSTREGQVAMSLLSNLIFDGKTLNNAALCGVLANIYAECSFNWDQEPVLDSNNKYAFGLCMWNGGRFDSLKEFGKNNTYYQLDVQVKYLKHEFDTHSEYEDTKNAMISVPNTIEGAKEMALTWASNFERCAHVYNGVDQWAKRQELAATMFWPKYNNLKPTVDYIVDLFEKEGASLSSNINFVLVAKCSENKLFLFKRYGTSNVFTLELSDIKLYCGKGGASKSKTGGQNDITPLGSYKLGDMKGVGENPGIDWSTHYTKITDTLFWVTDTSSSHYNSIVSYPPTSKDWSTAIQLSKHQSTYKYAFVIGYNTSEKDKKKGCSVALQCGTAPTTTGSLAISSNDMLKLITTLDGGYGKTQILITN